MPREDKNYESTLCQQPGHLDTNEVVDSDYTNDSIHRIPVTAIPIKITGEAKFYKTNFQSTIVLRSIEAEFIAACEVAKVILYI